MLPILRLIPVGGVTLAIVILLLALTAPGSAPPTLPRPMMPARGALIASADHPEWPQLLVNAALRRANELNQLRQLTDTPVAAEIKLDEKRTEKPAEIAGVPESRSEAEPEGATGTVAQSPKAAIPVDIGEASSTELPVSHEKEQPPVIVSPQYSEPAQKQSLNVPPEAKKEAPEPKKPAESTKVKREPEKPVHKKIVRRSRRVRITTQPADPAQFNLLAAFFASFEIQQPPATRQQNPQLTGRQQNPQMIGDVPGH